MRSDWYDSEVAAVYEAERAGKAGWQLETEVVNDFLSSGPVLDVPFGTGRFVDLYRRRGFTFTGVDISPAMLAQARAKYGNLDTWCGSIFSLPFNDGEFAVVVCVRLMPWLEPKDMWRAIAEAARVGRRLIVSVRIGVEGTRCRRGSYTHDADTFAAAVAAADLRIVRARSTATTLAGTFMIYQCDS